MQDPATTIEEATPRRLGHMAQAAMTGGVVGATSGLVTGGIRRGMAMGTMGTLGGLAVGHMAAEREQQMAREQLGKTASAYLAGCEHARRILALPEGEKQAVLKSIDTALGHAVGAGGQLAGKAMQAVGHAGKALEEASREHLDPEVAGRVAGGALLVGGTALAMHAMQQQHAQDLAVMNNFGGAPWT